MIRRLIVAIIRPRLNEGVEHCTGARVRGLTVSRVLGHGGETERVENLSRHSGQSGAPGDRGVRALGAAHGQCRSQDLRPPPERWETERSLFSMSPSCTGYGPASRTKQQRVGSAGKWGSTTHPPNEVRDLLSGLGNREVDPSNGQHQLRRSARLLTIRRSFELNRPPVIVRWPLPHRHPLLVGLSKHGVVPEIP